MAYHTDLTPAWANPFWTIPPAGTEWRSAARLVGGGDRLDADDRRPDDEHALLRHRRRRRRAYYPSLRPGSDPRADSLIAVDLATGKLKWWQQQLAVERVGLRHLAAAARLHGEDRRQEPAHRLDRDDGGRLVRLRRRDRRADLPAREGDRQRRAPGAQAGQAGRRLPVVARRAQLLARVVRPADELRLQRGGRDRVGAAAADAGAGAEPAAARSATPSSGSRTATSASTSRAGWRDYGSVSAIDVATGKRVWKFNTPEPERGGVTTTASGLGFVGGGDGVLRAFDAKTGQGALEVPDGLPDRRRARRSTRSNGTEYVAITVGGTATSSSGGTVASQLQVFALGGSQTQSPAVHDRLPGADDGAASRVASRRGHAARAAPCAAASGAGRRGSSTPGAADDPAVGPEHVEHAGRPGPRRCSPASRSRASKVSVDGWVAPRRPTRAGRSPTRPTTRCRRGTSSTVASVDRRDDRRPAADRRAAERRAGGEGRHQRRLRDRRPLDARPGREGTVVVTGRLGYGKGLGAAAGRGSTATS